jgi:CheY-like chemotaxis protein
VKDRRSILVVDGDMQVRHLLAFLLDREGYDVQLAGDGLKAVDELRKQQFDVVLADCQTPELDGLRLCLLVRILWPHIPVILMTAGSEGVKGWGAELGVFAWLPKPFTSDKVLRHVQTAVASEYVS